MTYHCRKCGRFMRYVGNRWEETDPVTGALKIETFIWNYAICSVHGWQVVDDDEG